MFVCCDEDVYAAIRRYTAALRALMRRARDSREEEAGIRERMVVDARDR